MQDTTRTITRFYLVAGIWLAVMIAATVSLVGPMGVLYAAVDVGATVRTVVTMSIAVVVASAAAGLAWNGLRRPTRADVTADRPAVAASDEEGVEATLVATR